MAPELLAQEIVRLRRFGPEQVQGVLEELRRVGKDIDQEVAAFQAAFVALRSANGEMSPEDAMRHVSAAKAALACLKLHAAAELPLKLLEVHEGLGRNLYDLEMLRTMPVEKVQAFGPVDLKALQLLAADVLKRLDADIGYAPQPEGAQLIRRTVELVKENQQL